MFGNQWHLATRTRRAEIARISIVVASLVIGAAFWVAPASTQQRGGAPVIEIAAEIIVAPAAVTPLEIKINHFAALPQNAMLIIRGLPPRMMLSEGRSFSPGVWAVPLGSVGKIDMTPHDASGQSNLTMELLTLDGKVLANAASTLYILPPGVVRDITASTAGNEKGNRVALTAGPLASRPDSPATAMQTPANLTPLPSHLTQPEIENAVILITKGDENMLMGKISAARLFYKSAAESGYAPAALALGATYDGRQLSQWKLVSGQQADPAMARKWYEKALELGAPEASDRLQALGVR